MAAKRKEEAKMSPEEYTAKFLLGNKKFHYNYMEDLGDVPVSTGSLMLDAHIDGGLRGGCHMFCGANGAGKTAEALEVIRQAIKADPNTRGLYIKAEGRLSSNRKKSSGLKFTQDPEEWEDGTVFVFECNVFDVVSNYIRGLIQNNPEKKKFVIVIDSMHGLIPQCDLDKTASDAAKVAGGALLATDLLRRCSLPISKGGHICIMILQVRAAIAATAYTPKNPNNQTNSSASNASLHFSDWILEYKKMNQSDYILSKDGPITPSNPALGHYAKVLIRKADNDNRGMEIPYPIKHNRKDGRAIWIEREIVDLLLSWDYFEKKGAWFHFDDEIKQLFEEHNLEVKQPVQGMDKLYALLENDEKVLFVLKKFVEEKVLSKIF